MKYLPVCLLVLAVPACAEHHELTACKGPYLALTPPPPVATAPKAAVPKAAPIVAAAPATSQVPPKPNQQQTMVTH